MRSVLVFAFYIVRNDDLRLPFADKLYETAENRFMPAPYFFKLLRRAFIIGKT